MVSIPHITLNDGHPFPVLGLGTYGLRGEDGIASLVAGIEAGYRLLDTAVNYENEAEVGDAIRRSGVDRDELIVTTKIPGRSHGFPEALASTNESLIVLGLERIDLSLIHWPNPRVDKYVDTWRAMIELRERGSLRSIGVSNFTEAMLTRLIDETGVAPAVNQVELHPYFPQTALRAFHARHGIRTESWSPLAQRSELLTEPLLRDLAEVHAVKPSQVVLRWHIDSGSTPIPKSGDPDRQQENADIFDFELDADELAAVSALEKGRLWGADPDSHEEF